MTEIKISVIGPGGAGKSSIVIRFIQNVFILEYDPTIEDSYRKQVKIPDFHGQVDEKSPTVLLDILDTAGQEEYSAMRDRYLRVTNGFVVVYSVTSRSDFEALEPLIEQILRVKDEEIGDVPMVLVANKLDLADSRQVSSLEGAQFAAKYKMPYIEASAKADQNVANTFYDVSKLVLECWKRKGISNSNPRRERGKKGLFSKQKNQQNSPFEVSTHVPTNRIFDQHNEYQKPAPGIDIPNSTYLRDMTELLQERDFTDVRFKTTDSKELIHAHKFIVIARSGSMRTIIEGYEKATNAAEPIPVPFKCSTFKLFLQYAYTDSVTIEEGFQSTEIPPLLELAKQWGVPDLIIMLAKHYPANVPVGQSEPLAQEESLHSIPKYKRDLRRALFASGSDYKSFDVKFIIKDEPGKSILAHKAILAQRSAYFRAEGLKRNQHLRLK